MPRPDFSDYVVHFTKDVKPLGGSKDETMAQRLGDIAKLSAEQRLVRILNEKTIVATPMPWTGLRAVAFTECTWGSLLIHAQRYSSFGIGFRKDHLFAAGGGPAIYLRADLVEYQREHLTHLGASPDRPFDPRVWAFVTPFAPSYAPAKYMQQFWAGRAVADFTHEREWRVPHDFTFAYTRVAFVIVENYIVMARVPKNLKDAIGRRKFLIMDNYRQVENFWPQHLLHP